jgi:hypothetical protein
MNTDKLFEKASLKHAMFVMQNKRLFIDSINFSTVQYMWERGHRTAMKFNKVVLDALKQVDQNASFLNMGTAAGHLALCNRLYDCGLDIHNVEWDYQVECCEVVRNTFGINIDYLCNNVNDNDFQIFNCDKKYDYVILQRFFPVYHTQKKSEVNAVLKKFVPYAKKAIVIESNNNWNKDLYEHVVSISEKRSSISDIWNLFVIDLQNIV